LYHPPPLAERPAPAGSTDARCFGQAYVRVRRNNMSSLLTQFSEAISEVVSAARASILRVDGARRIPVTGIAWSPDLVITAAHAIRARQGISVARDDGQSFAATIVGGDNATDIALLRIPNAALQPVRWSERELRTGNFVVVAGRPGRSVRAAIGVASAVGGEWRTHDGSSIDRYIDVDASLPKGFSGGPLLDTEGGAIGMNTSRVTRGGTTIPHATLERVVTDLLRHGTVPRPILGIGVYPVESGLLIISVQDDSAAARSGLMVGDLVVKVDGNDMQSPRELQRALQNMPAGKEIELGFKRGGELKTVRVALGPSEARGPRPEA
jgi:serine protease DegQ